MKRLTSFHRAAFTVAALLILVLFATGPATFGGDGEERTLELRSYVVDGSQVRVKVDNPSSDAKSAVVVVEAEVNGGPVTGLAGVTLFGNQSAMVTLGFPADVQDVISVGVTTDSPSPF